MPLAAILIPLLPGLIDSVIDIVDAIGDDSSTPEETREKLRILIDELRALNAEIQAAPLPGDE